MTTQKPINPPTVTAVRGFMFSDLDWSDHPAADSILARAEQVIAARADKKPTDSQAHS